MQKNIGLTDRALRLILALIFLAYAWWQASLLALFIALFIIFEVMTSWCLVYQILGKNSCPIKTNKSK